MLQIHHYIKYSLSKYIKFFYGSVCFTVKYFLLQNVFRWKWFFFSVFGCIPKNILQCCVKDRAEGVGGEAYVFEKWFTKKLGVNHFPNFNKRFSGPLLLSFCKCWFESLPTWMCYFWILSHNRKFFCNTYYLFMGF